MNLTLLIAATGVLGGLLIGWLIGAYMVLRDHADLIDDGLAFRSLLADAATASCGGDTQVGDVRGEAHVTHLRVIEGGVA